MSHPMNDAYFEWISERLHGFSEDSIRRAGGWDDKANVWDELKFCEPHEIESIEEACQHEYNKQKEYYEEHLTSMG